MPDVILVAETHIIVASEIHVSQKPEEISGGTTKALSARKDDDPRVTGSATLKPLFRAVRGLVHTYENREVDADLYEDRVKLFSNPSYAIESC